MNWPQRFESQVSGLSPHTKDRYRQLVGKFVEVVGNKEAYDVSDLSKFLARYSGSYARFCFYGLKTFYELNNWPWWDPREAKRVRPRASLPHRPFLKADELRKVLAVAPKFGDMTCAMVRVCCIKPTRREELRRLNREAYRRPNLTIEIARSRTPRTVTITLDPTTCNILDSYLLPRELNPKDREPALFISSRGTRLSLPELSVIIKKVFRAAGVDEKGRGWHSLRRGTTTALHNAGMSERELQDYGGWLTPTMPHIYIQLEPGEVDRKARRINPLIDFEEEEESE